MGSAGRRLTRIDLWHDEGREHHEASPVWQEEST
jgi:hypothetical protein